ncbi:MAG: universal stress protein [Flavobacteriales bacterium]|nr:universal stress protein [Flavobacteriales bacterium]MCB9447911.1 universal stress protein [Flavobacteriales bacterium]
MKRILVAIDGTLLPEKSIACAQVLAGNKPYSLTGVYVPTLQTEHVHHQESSRVTTGQFPYSFSEEVYVDDEVIVGESPNQHKDAFLDRCRELGVNCTVHADDGELSHELAEESMFADLLIVSVDHYKSYLENRLEQRLLNAVLRKAMCPVVVAPAQYENIESLLVAYDGSPSSIFAMKQFALLFPDQLAKLPVHIVQVFSESSNRLTNEKLIKEFAQQHFRKYEIHRQTGDASRQIQAVAAELNNPLLIMGAFGRSLPSRIFHPSVGKEILQTGLFPFFVAHP